eukprot:26958_1
MANFTAAALSTWAEQCHQSDPSESLKKLKICLSTKHHPPIKEVIRVGVVPQIIHILNNNTKDTLETICSGYALMLHITHVPMDIIKLCCMYSINPSLQSDCTFILLNIAVGQTQHVQYLIDNGCIPVLTKTFADSSSATIKCNAIHCLSNICGDGPKYRDLVLNYGILNHVYELLQTIDFDDTAQLELLQSVAWSLSNFCRPDGLHWSYALIAVQSLSKMFQCGDEESLTCVCWGFMYLIQLCTIETIDSIGKRDDVHSEHVLQTIIKCGLKGLHQCLQHNADTVYYSALKAFGSLVQICLDDCIAQIICMGILEDLTRMLTCTRMDAKWVVLQVVDRIASVDKEYLVLLQQYESFRNIEELQRCDSNRIREKAVEIVQKCCAVQRLNTVIPVSSTYVCFKCMEKGDHWIMHCVSGIGMM